MSDIAAQSELALWQSYCDKKMECENLEDTITEQDKVISELKALVESAFREGYIQGWLDAKFDSGREVETGELDIDDSWDKSDALSDLAKQKKSKGE